MGVNWCHSEQANKTKQWQSLYLFRHEKPCFLIGWHNWVSSVDISHCFTREWTQTIYWKLMQPAMLDTKHICLKSIWNKLFLIWHFCIQVWIAEVPSGYKSQLLTNGHYELVASLMPIILCAYHVAFCWSLLWQLRSHLSAQYQAKWQT